ncbi:MAG: hypothetical protein IT564_11360 [Rhodospirillales bacterium]|nr:hypothetical protein [Rhodospirillales bacterium]
MYDKKTNLLDVIASVHPFNAEPYNDRVQRWIEFHSDGWFEPHVMCGPVGVDKDHATALFEALEKAGFLMPLYKVYCRRCDAPPIAVWDTPTQYKTAFCEDCCVEDDEDSRLEVGQFVTAKFWVRRPPREITLTNIGIAWRLTFKQRSIPVDEVRALMERTWRGGFTADDPFGKKLAHQYLDSVEVSDNQRAGYMVVFSSHQGYVLEAAMWVADQLNAELILA